MNSLKTRDLANKKLDFKIKNMYINLSNKNCLEFVWTDNQ